MLYKTPPHKLSHKFKDLFQKKSLPHCSSNTKCFEQINPKNKNKNQQLAAE